MKGALPIVGSVPTLRCFAPEAAGFAAAEAPEADTAGFDAGAEAVAGAAGLAEAAGDADAPDAGAEFGAASPQAARVTTRQRQKAANGRACTAAAMRAMVLNPQRLL
jgi:hypothetical protein